jgi:hypothetical protein
VSERRAEKKPALHAPAQPVPLARVDARAEHERTLIALLPMLRGFLFRLLGPRADLDDRDAWRIVEMRNDPLGHVFVPH